MKRLLPLRRRLLAAGTAATIVIVVGAGYGYAAITATSNNTYTGCLKAGNISSVAIGTSPASTCVKPGVQISWSETGPQGLPGQGLPGQNGTNGTDGVSVTSAPEAPGDNCAYGGSEFTAANGVTYACNGAKGDKGDSGDNGTNGTDGVSVTSAPEAPGANCTDGGSKFTAANGVVTYACNGARGDNGDGGTTTLAALHGSPCTLPNNDSASLDVSIASDGGVSISCRYEVKATVTGGMMTGIFINTLTGQVGQKTCLGSSSCATLIRPATHTLVTLQSGAGGTVAHPFHYTCPGGSSQAATSETHLGDSFYQGLCGTPSLSGNFAVTASFDD